MRGAKSSTMMTTMFGWVAAAAGGASGPDLTARNEAEAAVMNVFTRMPIDPWFSSG